MSAMNFLDRETSMLALLDALPYIRLFKNGVFVVKAGGAMCEDPAALRAVIDQIAVLRELGVRVVLVHGGGPQTTRLSKELGLETSFVEGRRVTCTRTLDVSVMTMNGSVNTALLAACRASGVPGVGLSGVDAGLIQAVRRPPQTIEIDGVAHIVDYGCVGDIVSVDTTAIEKLLDAGMVPVISPLCADETGQLLNVNADTVASTLARALHAEKLVFLTDTPGLLSDRGDPGSLVSYTDVRGLGDLQAKGAVDAGMLPKLNAAREALLGGVRRVHMVGSRGRAGLLMEIFTNEGAGTLIVKDTSELLPAEHAASEKPAGSGVA